MEDRKSRIKGGLLAFIGYILSPLSWWNDPFINLPIAYLFGSLFSLISHRLFLPFMVLGYWLTNILGLILMQHGVSDILGKSDGKSNRKKLILSILSSTLYTILIILLFYFRILKSPIRINP
jgi:xanthine/uracil permease